MKQHKINIYLLKFIIKIAFELPRVKQLAQQSEDSELRKILKKTEIPIDNVQKFSWPTVLNTNSDHKAKLVRKDLKHTEQV